MQKVGLEEKTKFRNELKKIIYSNSGIDASTKLRIDSDIGKKLFGVELASEDLERLKKETLDLLEKSSNKVIDKVSTNLVNPKKDSIGDVEDINTLKKDNGIEITSVKTRDGSIYVKDSSYSGNIKDVVSGVVKDNTDMTQQEIQDKAFKVMQERQIDIPITSINNSGLDDKTRSDISKLPGDNKKINLEYQILVDERNRLIDLKNMQNNSSNFNMSNEQEGKSKSNSISLKAKQLVKGLPGFKFNDAAFVDAMLLGSITLYTGVLGLCAILTKM